MTDAQASQLADQIRDFFDVFARASATLDLDVLTGLFAETFLSSDQAGAMVVPRAAFVRALPRRAQAFADAGVGPAVLTGLTHTELDPHHVLARTTWAAPRTQGGSAGRGGTDGSPNNNNNNSGGGSSSGSSSGSTGRTGSTASSGNTRSSGSSGSPASAGTVRLESSFLLRRDGECLSVVAYITHQGLGS